MIKKIIDSSYFSDILTYYPIDIQNFKFIWDKLEEKIKNNEIILLNVVYKELKSIQNDKFQNYLAKFDNLLEPTNQNDYIEIIDLYQKNQNKLKGSFQHTFGTAKKKINADPYLISKAIEIEGSVILTNEIMPNKPDNNGKKKLNIPSLAEYAKIKCLELRNSVDIIT